MSTHARSLHPPLLHPLSGSNLKTLVALLTSNGPIRPRRAPQVVIALAAALARWPFSTFERARFAALERKAAPPREPIFIVGHWRTGTTHLYNLLAGTGQFGYVSPFATGLPWDILGLARLLQPLLTRALPEHRYIDDVRVGPQSPQEDEIALASMTAPSFYHGLYFPRRLREHFHSGVFFDGCDAETIEHWQRTFVYFLKKLSVDQRGKRLLIKNPVYTARIGMLRELFPDAKFIHMQRNPYVVFASTKNFYEKLLQAFALQTFKPEDIENLILETYPRMLDRLLNDKRALPPDCFVEVRFEDLETRPLEELERVYQQLGLQGFEQARPYLEAHLDKVASHRKNRYSLQPESIRQVRSHWQAYLDGLGYEPPIEAQTP